MSLLSRAASALGIRAPIVRASTEVVTKRTRPSGGSSPIIAESPLWAQMRIIGGAISPESVSAAIRQADIGQMAMLMDLGNEARQKDCHLQSALATNEEAIARLRWELVLPKNPKLKERKEADRVEESLRNCKSLTRAISHHAGSAYYGYAVSEINWQNVRGYRVPEEFLPVAQRRFVFHPDTSRLCWYDPAGPMAYPGIDLRAAHPDKFLFSQPRVNGDSPSREGLIRPLVWAALFRNWSIADWLKLGEIAWKPWRWASYGKENAGEQEVADLISVLEGMSSSGVAALPDDVKMTIAWPQHGGGGKSQHHELFSTVASEMSKCVLGQTLTTEQGSIGSHALGEVHNEIRKDLRDARATFIAADFTRDVIEPMIRFNAGPDVRPPQMRFITDDVVDLGHFADAIKTLVEAGVRIPAKWVRDQGGIPEPADGEQEMLGAAPAHENPPATPPQNPPGAPKPPAKPPSKPGPAPPGANPPPAP